MTTFDEREQSYEKKYALDQEQLFKAHVRRDKLFGMWAAGKLGLSGAAADSYAKAIVSDDIANPGDKAIAAKVLKEFADKGIDVGATEVSAKLDELLAAAKTQIVSEAKG